MRIFKVLDFELYEKLMEIYRTKYQKLENTQTGGGNFEEQEESISKDELQEPEVEPEPQWTTFEQTVAEIRARQKDKKRGKKK